MKSINLLCVLLAVFSLAVSAKSTPAPKKTTHKPIPAKKAAPPADTSDEPNVWTPDPKMSSHLQAEQTFGPYTMRIPIGFIVKSQSIPSNKAQITGYEIIGPLRKDKTAPIIFLFVDISMPGFTTGSLEQMLSGNSFLNSQDSAVKTSYEYGEVNGLSVARQYYKYPFGKDDPRLIHGFHYAASEGTTSALVGAMDAEPYNTNTLPLCEAAARTLRKTN